jgi:hypothetical protein
MAGSIKLAAPSGGSVTLNAVDTASNFIMSVPAAAGVLINADSATGAAQLPVGTTAQRPASPVTGQMRFNSTTNLTEVYNGTAWVGVQTPYLAQVLIVGGGGGAGGYGGAGGAGGVIQGSLTLTSGLNYPVTIGAGGAGAPTRNNTAFNGSSSSFAYSIAAGGGKGGSDNSNGTYDATVMDGGSGGSGGGTSYASVGLVVVGSGNVPSLRPVQGYNGATGGSSTNIFGGAGGGAGAAAGAFTGPLAAAAGGAGISSTITGTAVSYGGGGGGSCSNASGTGGAGGAGGGGNGGMAAIGAAGTVNTGGGAGASWSNSGNAGGSGIVIISIQTAYYTGTTTGSPTVTVNGGFTVMKFTSSGSYTA